MQPFAAVEVVAPDAGVAEVLVTPTCRPRRPFGVPFGARSLPGPDSVFWPALLAALNGLAFYLVRPDVNDLWAARARASAVTHGVGLFYWFSWFGGGSAPGNYSILTPYLCAVLGTELVAALAAVAVAVLAWYAVRGTSYPTAASTSALAAAVFNLWSGRVPFLLGAAFGVGAVLALRGRRRWLTVGLSLLSVAASPVAGAFLALGLSGAFLHRRTRQWRPIIVWAVGSVLALLVLVGAVFGTPGPEPFPLLLALETEIGLVLAWYARPSDHVRTTLCLTALGTVVLFAVPNGMGANLGRFVWFCVPVLVLATSLRPLRTLALLLAPLLAVGGASTVSDLLNAARPVSSLGYYQSLAGELDTIAGLQNYRVEVVDHGAHAGYDALLGHAALARGWETQEDIALNQPLWKTTLAASTYRAWLDKNAVGYVALPATSVGLFPEYRLVQRHRPSYLRLMWSNREWRLFRVMAPAPIVPAPARLLDATQAQLRVRVPCACTLSIRVRYSKFLVARQPDGEVVARVTDDGTGWALLTTPRPGTYVLGGDLTSSQN